VFYNHPDFVAACADRLSAALEEIAEERRDGARLVFTAHSLPQPMADGCEYVPQLRETCRLVAEQLGVSDDRWQLVYQSRSGRPQDPWLEPDVVDALRQLHEQGAADAVVSPIGFLSDHLEVLYDLDHVARNACEAMGLRMVRAATVGTHPRFVAMIRKLIEERVCGGEREAIGRFGPHQDDCPEDCCPRPMPRPPQ
jgi:ferrochelatase